MSRDIEQQLHTPEATGPLFPPWKTFFLPACIVGVGALVALIVWTLPSWELFAQNAPRFSTLWQMEANRRAILILVLKVWSPLLVGVHLAACYWLWLLVQPFLPKNGLAQLKMGRPQGKPFHRTQQTRFPQIPVGKRVRLSATTDVRPLVVAERRTPPAFQDATNERKQRQIDPETPLPLMPDRPSSAENGLGTKEEAGLDTLHASPISSPNAVGGEDGATALQEMPVSPNDAPSRLDEPKPYNVSITLLKKVSMTLITTQGVTREVPLSLNAKRVQLLAYIAWRGQPVNRDRMLEQVFGHGRDDEDATREKLGESFDSHKKLIRWDLREAITRLNEEAGGEVIPPDLDVFSHKQRLYWLPDTCHVVDLEEVELRHKIIDLARKDGLLTDQVPGYVKEACDQLLAAYSGDFLEELITDYLDEFEPWTSSWARKPYTQFRDYYLQALWYAAEYEVCQGQQFSSERPDTEGEATRKAQRKHWDLAAQYYRTYAMSACNSRFDMKVTFGGGGREPGERVAMSERALRRSLVLYGSIGATHQVDQVYTSYYKQMRSISAKAWEPSTETLTDLRSAKAQTSAYRRLPSQPERLEQPRDTHQELPA